MADRIYLIQNDNSLTPLSEQPYANEDLLQTLLARYPDLLAGDQISEAAPRRWLLVSREFGVPGEADGGNRWSLDHLFLDQDAIPTLVEVKRSTDTRLRREVIGQMLDYAANAIVYWPVDTIRARFERLCEEQGLDSAQTIIAHAAVEIGDDDAVESFWRSVKTNLQAGRIRLIFVADQIPAELRRIVEFLNTHMDPVEVLAVELRQFTGQGLRTLVPRVIGLTAQAQQKKASAPREGRQWDEASFFVDLTERKGTGEAAAARRILQWARDRQLRIWWGKGVRDGSMIPTLDRNGASYFFAAIWTSGYVEMQFQHMRNKPPFDSTPLRQEFTQRLNALPGISLPMDAINRRPSFLLRVLKNEAAIKGFLDVLDWAMTTIHTSLSSMRDQLDRSVS